MKIIANIYYLRKEISAFFRCNSPLFIKDVEINQFTDSE